MKYRFTLRYISILFFFLISTGVINSQTVRFSSGNVEIDKNRHVLQVDLDSEESASEYVYRYITFSEIPDSKALDMVSEIGIGLIHYVPDNTYLAKIPTTILSQNLKNLKVVSVLKPELKHKLSLQLLEISMSSDVIGNELVPVYFRCHADVTEQQLLNATKNVPLAITQFVTRNSLVHGAIPANRIEQLAMLPIVRYMELEPPVGEPESNDGRNLHRSNAIDVNYSGGRNYDGSGVSVAVNDDGFVGPHIDFQGRANQQEVDGDLIGTHGDGVAGVLGSAGNLDPQNRGMAPGAYFHIRQYDSEMPGTVELHQDSGVMIFNSSYSNGCNAGYTLTTQLVDQEQIENPALIQVFSAGNSNNNDCGYGAGDQWGNITGGHKIGKNCIATANLTATDALVSSSSRGPAFDGRIKPDIAAHGQGQVSNEPGFGYDEFGGTSAAAPGIAGVLAQLYQAYREIYTEEAPAALLKCVLLNTATDMGNEGPDFKFGWGKVNALRAIYALEETRFLESSVDQGQSQQIQIDIPAGVRQAKIMVYWADEEADPEAEFDLVNDIDISVTDPTSIQYLPYVLDYTPNATSLNLPATNGEDHLNNMEQVVLTDPAQGSYTLNVTGGVIPFGTHTFYVCYDFLTDEVDLTYPLGGEGFEPNSTQRIHWDAFGNNDSFLLELSTDGLNWNELSTVSGSSRFAQFDVPDSFSGNAKVRISRNGFSDESDERFSIIGIPDNLRITDSCQNANEYNIRFEWDAVDQANGYDVFILGEKYMDSVFTTSDLFVDLVVPANVVSWVSVRATYFNTIIVGERAVAISFGWDESENVCLLSCTSSDDVGVSAIISPTPTGLNCGLGAVPVTITLENIGTSTQSGFHVSYSFNGADVTETVNATIAPNSTLTYEFDQLLQSPSSEGNYDLTVWTSNVADNTTCNDSLMLMLDFETNIGGTPFTEGFEGGTFPASNAIILNPDESVTWERITAMGSNGDSTNVMFMNNRLYEAEEFNRDIWRPISMNIPLSDLAYLTFEVAHRPYPGNTRSDTLRVEVSSDCGATFQTMYSKERLVLATGGLTGNYYEPESAEDWRTDTVDLSGLTGENIIVQFVNVNGFGNNIYIDNVNLFNGFTGIEETNNLLFTVYPNPTSDILNIGAPNGLLSDTQIDLVDISGRTLISESFSKNHEQIQVNVSGLAGGQYFILFTNGEGQRAMKFSISRQ